MLIGGRKLKKCQYKILPAPRAGENVSRKARTVNALIKTLLRVCNIPMVSIIMFFFFSFEDRDC